MRTSSSAARLGVVPLESLDFWCECGADLHLDGMSTGRFQCPQCLSEWVIDLKPRRPDANDYPHDATVMAEDDDG